MNKLSSKSESVSRVLFAQNVGKLLKEAKIDKLPPAEKQQLAQEWCRNCMEFCFELGIKQHWWKLKLQKLG